MVLELVDKELVKPVGGAGVPAGLPGETLLINLIRCLPIFLQFCMNAFIFNIMTFVPLPSQDNL